MEINFLSEIIEYEDANIAIINKPIGVISTFDGKNNESLDLLFKSYLESKGDFKSLSSPINRLDKDTSGLIIIAKNQKTLQYFNSIISAHEKIEKVYLTLVCGKIETDGEINAPLRKNFQLKKMVVCPVKNGGKNSITLFKPIHIYNDFTLVEAKLITGRTHQIRAHFSYIKHHVVGDYKYGDFKVNNAFKKQFGLETQLPHSYRLSFNNLDGEYSYLNGKVFEAKLPNKFENILLSLNII